MLKLVAGEFILNLKIGVLVHLPLFERVVEYLYYTTFLGKWIPLFKWMWGLIDLW